MSATPNASSGEHRDSRPITVPCYHVHDFRLLSKNGGENPFTVRLEAYFEHESGDQIDHLPGFYDADGAYVVRFSPSR